LAGALPPSLKIASKVETVASQVTIAAEAFNQRGGISKLAIYQNRARVLADGDTRQEGKTVYRTFKLALIEGEKWVFKYPNGVPFSVIVLACLKHRSPLPPEVWRHRGVLHWEGGRKSGSTQAFLRRAAELAGRPKCRSQRYLQFSRGDKI
jgi:hypothetical protein